MQAHISNELAARMFNVKAVFNTLRAIELLNNGYLPQITIIDNEVEDHCCGLSALDKIYPHNGHAGYIINALEPSIQCPECGRSLEEFSEKYNIISMVPKDYDLRPLISSIYHYLKNQRFK